MLYLCLDLAEGELGACLGDSLGESVEAVGLLGVREGDPHARGERRVQDDGRTLVAWRQVHRGHRADALAIQDDVLGTDTVSERNKKIFKVHELM